MQYLTHTSGQMVVHMSMVPGLHQSSFVSQRIRYLADQDAGGVIVMHSPAPKDMDSLPAGLMYWPQHEGLWDHGVLQRVLELKPRLVILPHLSIPTLHEAEHEQYIDNIITLLESGATVETSLSIVQVARVDDLLTSQIEWPEHSRLTGDFLRAHVGDYVVHDAQPQEVLTRYYQGNVKIPECLKGKEPTLFNLATLNRLREVMLRFVNNHISDIARQTNPSQSDVFAPRFMIDWQEWLRHTAFALAADLGVIALVHMAWKYLAFPFEAVGLVLLATPIVTALYVNPLTTFLATVVTFLAFNSLFMPASFPESLANPSQAITLLTFVCISLVVSFLTSRQHLHDRQSAEQAIQLNALLRLAYDMSYAETSTAVVQAGVGNLRRTLSLPAVVVKPDGELWPNQGKTLDLPEEQVDAAKRCMEHGTIITKDEWMWCPLNLKRTVLGAIGLRLNNRGAAPSWSTMNMMRAYSDMMVTAMRRMQLRRATEDATQDAERESLRSALLSAVSHDLKTPLVSIIGSLSTMRQLGTDLPEDDRQELLITATEEAERLHSIIHNVLEITRLESGDVQPRTVEVDMGAMLDALRERCRRYYPDLKLEVLTPPPLPWVLSDPLLLEEVLYNLIDNAAKYAGTSQPFEVTVEGDGETTRLTICDSGPGIAEEDIDKVFDKYFRSAQKDSRTAGSGLGLAISRAIVEASHGRIWAENRDDGKTGLKIVMELPQVEPPTKENDDD